MDPEPPKEAAPTAAPPSGPAALREAIWVFLGATAAVAALYWIGKAVPFVHRNLGGLVALVFLVLPIRMLDRAGEPLGRYGIDWRPLGRGLAWGLGAVVLILGGFLLVYVLYFQATCGQGHALLGPLGRQCSRWVGDLHHLTLRTPPDFWSQVLGQVVVVAIPEEIFYRGYLLGRLERALPARHHLWGSPVGAALLLQAALFGLGHFLVDFNPLRLAVAIPALAFGLLRNAGGSVVPSVLLHASANVLMLVVDPSFFPRP